MCGIAGIIDFRGRPIDRDTLQRMQAALAHRGPDDAGIWTHETSGFSVGLVHTRLAVLDPTPHGHQPMVDGQGRCAIAYNGELYNFREISARLQTPQRTDCDTETVLHACLERGPDALAGFDGMWALAFVDTDRQHGHLSRDPIGIKPLHYSCHDQRLIFASEMRAMRCVKELPTEIDDEALRLYLLLGFIPHPWTICRSIRKLPPGHRLDFDANGPREPERFFRLASPPGQPLPYEEARRQVRSTIDRAVVRQRIADVPLGAFLSGGMDSAVVVSALARAGGTVKTFSIGYADHPRYDETRYARIVADRFRTEHQAFKLTFADVLAAVEPMLNHLGEPFADSSLLPTAVVSRHTRGHVTVALSGDGGDELFGGYWRYLGHHYLNCYHRLPAVIRRGLIEPLLSLVPSARTTPLLDRFRRMRKLLRGDRADPLDRHLAWARTMDEAWAARLLGRPQADATTTLIEDLYSRVPGNWREEHRPSDALDRILLADLALSLPADMLHKVDLAGMAFALEVRVPLLSADVVNLVTSLPTEYKISGTTTKRILRDAFRDVLPKPILSRRKMGFEVPVGEFLRRELRPMFLDTVTPDALSDLGLDPAAATDLYDRHVRRHGEHTELLWALLILCWWKRSI
ncbi:MAG TPA: asparagine synthase (glutamine-hydrolyzing) [Phycisphaerae bacterium]|nr:asparagine synthase (glutamine-hydrolyzing) [Phycisphaerae bacterium]